MKRGGERREEKRKEEERGEMKRGIVGKNKKCRKIKEGVRKEDERGGQLMIKRESGTTTGVAAEK